MSVRELLGHLGGIEEPMMLYKGGWGRPCARRMFTEMEHVRARLYDLSGLDAYAPQSARRELRGHLRNTGAELGECRRLTEWPGSFRSDLCRPAPNGARQLARRRGCRRAWRSR